MTIRKIKGPRGGTQYRLVSKGFRYKWLRDLHVWWKDPRTTEQAVADLRKEVDDLGKKNSEDFF
jgi:hypothetical protein